MARMPFLPPLEQMIRELVAIPSVSSVEPELDQGNGAVCDLLSGWLEDLGLRAERLPVPGQPGKFNLLAASGGGDEGLVLSGHTDTVPLVAQRWTTDPYGGTTRDGRLYGLGSADMKSFLAVAVQVASRLPLSRLRRPRVLLATADEESGMAGARALAEAGRRPGRQVIIGEPTGLVPVDRHKGVFMERIRVLGREGHGSDPASGRNAIEGMVRVIGVLGELRAELAARCRDETFAVPGPTVNLGRIRGGDNPNRICGACELSLDLRLPPGLGAAEVRCELRERVQSALAKSGFETEFTALFAGVDPLATTAERGLADLCAEVSGHPPAAVAFGTEGPFFQALGMEVVVWGPGDIAVAHQPDEFVRLGDAERAIQLVSRVARRLCLEAA
jgi:acetylornithine deacetylase